MEPTSVPKFVYKMRRWLSKSRANQGYTPVATKDHDSPPGPSRFLELPSEIRNMIYRELLLSTRPLIVHFRKVYWFESGARPYPAILQTNRQIHDEAAAVLYGENTFFSAQGNDFFSWADEILQGERSTYVAEPGPINTYLPWIKHFVLFPDGPPAWVRNKVVAAGDVEEWLKRMGIRRAVLTQLVIGCLSQEMCDEIESANEDWLESVDESEMQRRFDWFTKEGSQPAYWLVLKEREVKLLGQ